MNELRLHPSLRDGLIWLPADPSELTPEHVENLRSTLNVRALRSIMQGIARSTDKHSIQTGQVDALSTEPTHPQPAY